MRFLLASVMIALAMRFLPEDTTVIADPLAKIRENLSKTLAPEVPTDQETTATVVVLEKERVAIEEDSEVKIVAKAQTEAKAKIEVGLETETEAEALIEVDIVEMLAEAPIEVAIEIEMLAEVKREVVLEKGVKTLAVTDLGVEIEKIGHKGIIDLLTDLKLCMTT